MKASLFEFPVEIRKVEWPWRNQASQEDVFVLLDSYFPDVRSIGLEYEFHEVSRPDYGLVRSVMTVSPSLPNNEIQQKDISTIRLFQKPTEENIAFDLAEHHKSRILNLSKALGSKHYPQTTFLQSDTLLVILQPFLFYPVCDFSANTDILCLIDLIYLASKSQLLLDYNHNHFLRAKDSTLFYVDTDYMGNKTSDLEDALKSNLNQAMVFINVNNISFIPQELTKFSLKSEMHKNFAELFLQEIRRYIKFGETQKEHLTAKLEKKVLKLKHVFEGYDL
jgi:hypothetical protein